MGGNDDNLFEPTWKPTKPQPYMPAPCTRSLVFAPPAAIVPFGPDLPNERPVVAQATPSRAESPLERCLRLHHEKFNNGNCSPEVALAFASDLVKLKCHDQYIYQDFHHLTMFIKFFIASEYLSVLISAIPESTITLLTNNPKPDNESIINLVTDAISRINEQFEVKMDHQLATSLQKDLVGALGLYYDAFELDPSNFLRYLEFHKPFKSALIITCLMLKHFPGKPKQDMLSKSILDLHQQHKSRSSFTEFNRVLYTLGLGEAIEQPAQSKLVLLSPRQSHGKGKRKREDSCDFYTAKQIKHP